MILTEEIKKKLNEFVQKELNEFVKYCENNSSLTVRRAYEIYCDKVFDK